MVGKKGSNTKKYVVNSLLLFLVVVGFIIFFCIRTLMEIGVAMQGECKVVSIAFVKNEITLYIVMRDYGLYLQNYHTIISKNNVASDDVAIDHKADIICPSTDRLYYKVKQPDSLLILEPSWDGKIDSYDIEGIHVVIKRIKDDSLKVCAPQWGYQLLELYSE